MATSTLVSVASSWLWAPDLTLLLLAFGTLMLTTAGLRATWLGRAARRRRPHNDDHTATRAPREQLAAR